MAEEHFSPIFPKTDPPHLFTIRVVQHCVAISARAELLLRRGVRHATNDL